MSEGKDWEGRVAEAMSLKAAIAKAAKERRSRWAHVVFVTGGREFRDSRAVADALDALEPSSVIEGGGGGACSLARQWALENNVLTQCYYPHDRTPPGYIRTWSSGSPIGGWA